MCGGCISFSVLPESLLHLPYVLNKRWEFLIRNYLKAVSKSILSSHFTSCSVLSLGRSFVCEMCVSECFFFCCLRFTSSFFFLLSFSFYFSASSISLLCSSFGRANASKAIDRWRAHIGVCVFFSSSSLLLALHSSTEHID